MIIEKKYVNQLRLTRYNIKIALQPFKDYEPYPHMLKNIQQLDEVISAEYDDGKLDTVIYDLLHEALLLSRDMLTPEQQDDFKELHTHINMLDAISNKIHERNHKIIDYTCYWSEGSGCKYCQHAHCIFNEEWMRNESKKIVLQNKIKEEKKIKQDKNMPNGDRLQAYKNIRKYKKELDSINKEKLEQIANEGDN